MSERNPDPSEARRHFVQQIATRASYYASHWTGDAAGRASEDEVFHTTSMLAELAGRSNDPVAEPLTKGLERVLALAATRGVTAVQVGTALGSVAVEAEHLHRALLRMAVGRPSPSKGPVPHLLPIQCRKRASDLGSAR